MKHSYELQELQTHHPPGNSFSRQLKARDIDLMNNPTSCPDRSQLVGGGDLCRVWAVIWED